VHALRHSQRDFRTRYFDPTHFAQHSSHQQCGATGARGVTIALEPHQEGVTPKLEQAAAVLVCDSQDRLEACADRFRNLLGSFAALTCETFRQLRESRNVHEYGSAFCGPMARRRIADQVLLEGARHIRDRTMRVNFGVGRGRSSGVGRARELRRRLSAGLHRDQ
jgi:hypothetical protein